MLGALRAHGRKEGGKQIRAESGPGASTIAALALTPVGSRKDRGAGDVLA